jgi:hypothetical protein
VWNVVHLMRFTHMLLGTQMPLSKAGVLLLHRGGCEWTHRSHLSGADGDQLGPEGEGDQQRGQREGEGRMTDVSQSSASLSSDVRIIM